MDSLAKVRQGTVFYEKDFKKTMDENFTLYYHLLRPWINRLRKVVFPNRERYDVRLYSRMKNILQEAKKDPEVLAEAKTDSQVLITGLT